MDRVKQEIEMTGMSLRSLHTCKYNLHKTMSKQQELLPSTIMKHAYGIYPSLAMIAKHIPYLPSVLDSCFLIVMTKASLIHLALITIGWP